MKQWHPFCNIKVHPDNITASVDGTNPSIEIELLKMLSARYNFTFNLIYGGNRWGNDWEVEMGTANWTGLIGQVVNKVIKIFKLTQKLIKI